MLSRSEVIKYYQDLKDLKKIAESLTFIEERILNINTLILKFQWQYHELIPESILIPDEELEISV